MSDRVIPLYDALKYPGHGMGPREESLLEPLSSWARLVEYGGALGGKGNLLYDSADNAEQTSPVDLLDVQGSDRDACPLVVTLGGPYAIPRRVSDLPIDLQNQTGELDNLSVGDDNYPGTAAPIIWPPFVAIVEWGVGGARSRAYVDWREGATISVPASWLRVHALVPPDGAANAPGTTGLYTLAAFAAPGWARSRNAQRTIYLGSVNAGASSAVFAVPPFAETATVLALDPAGNITAGTIQFWQSPDGVTGNVGNYLQSGNTPGQFPIPNGAAYFSVLSGMGGAVPFAVCFGLSI